MGMLFNNFTIFLFHVFHTNVISLVLDWLSGSFIITLFDIAFFKRIIHLSIQFTL